VKQDVWLSSKSAPFQVLCATLMVESKDDSMSTKAKTPKSFSSFLSHIRYEHLLAGVSGGVTSSLILHPLDLIKIRFAGKCNLCSLLRVWYFPSLLPYNLNCPFTVLKVSQPALSLEVVRITRFTALSVYNWTRLSCSAVNLRVFLCSMPIVPLSVLFFHPFFF